MRQLCGKTTKLTWEIWEPEKEVQQEVKKHVNRTRSWTLEIVEYEADHPQRGGADGRNARFSVSGQWARKNMEIKKQVAPEGSEQWMPESIFQS